jgi:chromosome segregation ATPase
LSALATKVEEDPFGKVKKLIEDLVYRLMEEANQEAEHKGWCDKELQANADIKKTKTDEVDTLTSEIDELTAQINKLSQEITDLNTAVADLDVSVSGATENRQKEKTENEQTIKDSSESQQAVAQALVILKDFYAKAGAPALVQQTPTADAPISWDAAYTGQLGSASIVDFLEVIQSDFARLESETKADEEAAAKAYETLINESALNKLTMQKDVEFKTNKKLETSNDKEQKNADLAAAQKELDAALEYYEKLKPACIDSGVTYEDRVAQRKSEIESLKQALEILSGNAAEFLQTRKASIRRHA